MTEDDIIRFATSLPGVVAVTASEATGAPAAAWGDSFFSYDPDGDARDDRWLPFATIVTGDYAGFDTASRLDRAGVFRLNIAVGGARFEELLGYPPAAHPDHAADFDYAVTDRLLPHPVYAAAGWVSILNPGKATSTRARSLLTEAHAAAVRRHRPRRS